MCALSVPKESEAKMQTRFLKSYGSFFNQAQLLAQRENHDVDFIFQHQVISFISPKGQKRELDIPKGMHTEPRRLSLKANGYVAPTSIVFLDDRGKPRFSLIYSLGFGNYRVADYD
ncbi:hypothetical protein NT95_00475 [Oenococcus kitaharae]|nr:hypothetical protein NT96_07435 [Oenococcus kitaharae]OEY82707.1 hypothetical protein NV75_07880 [Oenococcus kitaharae]OEY84962.1 hypothetical protein NT95_00475 [Oenococcus kitaharae]